jgi:hypothetical protein
MPTVTLLYAGLLHVLRTVGAVGSTLTLVVSSIWAVVVAV